MIELNERKVQLSRIVETYQQSGRFTSEFVNRYNDSFNSEVLRIGVVGKMKVGKSSLLNALLFGRNVLPVGSTPTTVTLTEIEYSEEESVEVTFLTQEDIAQLETLTQNKLAEEILEKVRNIPDYEELLGQVKKNIPFEKLETYVASNGDYAGVVKSVKIKLNNENLMGLSIVDTPGFNDPIASRGETTKKALQDVHIVLYVWGPGFMDDADKNLFTEQLENSGVLDTIGVVNQIDRRNGHEHSIQDWERYDSEFQNSLTKEVERWEESSVKEMLSHTPIKAVSSWFYLLGTSKKEGVKDSIIDGIIGKYKIQYFPILNTTEDFIKYSRINEVTQTINEFVQKKEAYLIESPAAILLGELKIVRNTIEAEIAKIKNDINLLRSSQADAEQNLQVIDNLLNNSVAEIRNPNFLSSINNAINGAKSQLISERDRRSANEFTQNKYPESTLTSTGIRKHNLGNYFAFTRVFNMITRDAVCSCKDTISSEIETFVNNIVSKLVHQNISNSMQTAFKNALYMRIIPIKNSVDTIIVPPKQLKDPLTGAMDQYLLYQQYFENVYDDRWIGQVFERFEVITNDNFPQSIEQDARKEINSIRQKLLAVIRDPQSIRQEIEKENEKITKLNKELEKINNDINYLKEIKL